MLNLELYQETKFLHQNLTRNPFRIILLTIPDTPVMDHF